MKKIALALAFLFIVVASAIAILTPRESDPDDLAVLKTKVTHKPAPSVDHSTFPVLKQRFDSPQQVTAACISCHQGRAVEVMQSNHWNWEREEFVEGRGIVYLGKKNAINNFCIGVEGNEKSCAKCHIGFGMTDQTQAFTDPTNIDCLVCHDQTETYAKAPEQGGAPAANLDFSAIAQHVGRPRRSNCGVCHFFGGGGNNVKHGDLDKAMFDPLRDVDVHMGTDGINATCVDCHTTEKHTISGKLYSLSSMNRNRATCEQCHTEHPHKDATLDQHTLKVACQTCHIPIYAKVNATKTDWDWSTAGRLRNGEPYEEDDADGNHVYLSIKGSFTWGKKLKPEYVWFNGTASHYLLGDVIQDTSRPLAINQLHGSYGDNESKIIPVKIHRARQPYDPVNRMLIQPKLFADAKGEGALWKDFDWQRASEVGMRDVNLPFSGQIAFIQTEMYWPINHMVSRKEESLACTECHTREGGRLANLRDFYMPARDHSPVIDTAGVGLMVLSLIGVGIHGAVRIVTHRKRRSGGEA